MCSRQATRLWICSTSTRPPNAPSCASSCRRPSSGDGVQLFVATTTSPRTRRAASARPSTPSARPYIGEVSTRRVPPSTCVRSTATVSISCREETSNTFHVPKPITGTSRPFAPNGRSSTRSGGGSVLGRAVVLAQEALELGGDVLAARDLEGGRVLVLVPGDLGCLLEPAHVGREVAVLLDRLGDLPLEYPGGELDLPRVDLEPGQVAKRLEQRERDLGVPRLRQVVGCGRPQRQGRQAGARRGRVQDADDARRPLVPGRQDPRLAEPV